MKNIIKCILILSFVSSSVSGQISSDLLRNPTETIPEKKWADKPVAQKLFGPQKSIYKTNNTKTLTPELSLLQTCLALGFILFMISVLFYIFRKIRNKINGPESSNLIKVYSQTSLDTKSSLALVRVRGEEYFIGITQQGISLLSQFEIENQGEDVGKTDTVVNKNVPFSLDIFKKTNGEDLKSVNDL